MPSTADVWLVVRADTAPGSKSTSVRYRHRDAAFDAARKLAKQTGHDFLVMGPDTVVTPRTANTQSDLF